MTERSGKVPNTPPPNVSGDGCEKYYPVYELSAEKYSGLIALGIDKDKSGCLSINDTYTYFPIGKIDLDGSLYINKNFDGDACRVDEYGLKSEYLKFHRLVGYIKESDYINSGQIQIHETIPCHKNEVKRK